MADKSETFVPLFLLGYQLARFTVVSPPNRSLLLASLPVCPDLCSRLIVLGPDVQSLSLPAHRKDYHTRNACLLASTRLVPPTIIEPTFSFPSDALSISFPLHSLSRFCSNVFLVRVTRLGSEYCFFENHRAKRRESEFYFFELYIFSLSR